MQTSSSFDLKNKALRLFIVLAAFFLCNALVAEFMGVKIFSLDDTLGLTPLHFHIFGEEIVGFSLTCGVLLWPFVFIMTDIINEYFGIRGVRFLSIIAAAMVAYSFVMLNLGMHTAPASWWIHSSNYGEKLNFQEAYLAVFGQGNNIIVGSLIAFIIGQLLDVYIFHAIKKRTGEKYIWLRSTGSTLFSQFIDSFVVLFYAFYIAKVGQAGQWTIPLVLAVGSVNYIYKFIMAIALTPMIYLGHKLIELYLGKELAQELKDKAHHQ
ncbi:MAG: queuosine precursor transporter [Bacteroidota bacterium]